MYQRQNSQCIDDKIDTTNNTTTTTYLTTTDNPQHHKTTAPHTNTYQQKKHTSFPSLVVFLRIHDELLIAFWRRAFARFFIIIPHDDLPPHHHPPGPLSPSSSSPSSPSQLHNKAQTVIHLHILSQLNTYPFPAHVQSHFISSSTRSAHEELDQCRERASRQTTKGPRSMHSGTEGSERES